MTYNDLVYIDFKRKFYPDFNFFEKNNVKKWVVNSTYSINDLVYIFNPDTYYEIYKCNANITSITEPYNDLVNWTKDTSVDILTLILEEDLKNPLISAKQELRYPAITDPDIQIEGCLLLTAHYLILDKEISSMYKINPDQLAFTASRSIKDMSVSYQIPMNVLNNPVLRSYFSTSYGRKYYNLLARNVSPIYAITTTDGYLDES